MYWCLNWVFNQLPGSPRAGMGDGLYPCAAVSWDGRVGSCIQKEEEGEEPSMSVVGSSLPWGEAPPWKLVMALI